MAAATILDFEIAKFYWLLWQRGSRHISMPKFVKIGQSVAKILRFFSFFKMAAAAICDCQIHKILLADRVRRVQTHQCIKFHQNRSFHCGDIAILQIFKMAATAIVIERVQTHQHAKFRQNRSVGCEDIKLFNFSRWRPPPSWIFEIVNFYLLTLSGWPRLIIVPNFVKIGRSVTDILRFFEFSRWQQNKI